MNLCLQIKMKIKFIFLFIFLVSCTSFGEVGKALRNEKSRTTDEFLIEKRGPLSLPPKMNELPKPNTKNTEDVNKRIDSTKPKTKSEIENILLEEIRKN
jgi:hypothetical protein